MTEASFEPLRLLRNGHVQSLLASSSVRRALVLRRARGVLGCAREMLIDAGEGVRLQGFHSPRDNARGLVVLLHGWKGSVNSTYLVESAQRLWDAGYSVVRLNFRDHGGTEHLNPDIFHSCRLDEVVGATAAIAAAIPARPLCLAGYSLGGNFALRVALRAPAAGIPVSQLVAISPVIDPAASLAAIESAWWPYHAHFMRTWRGSLRRKQALFPERYSHNDVLQQGMRDLTAMLVERYTEFPDLHAYLDGYSVAGERLAKLEVPATIVTARDDPVIPAADFFELQLSPGTELMVLPFGGHCGFIRDLRLASWAARFIVHRLERARAASPLQEVA